MDPQSFVLDHQGRARACELRVPVDAQGQALPLVLQLHGRGIGPVQFDRWTGHSDLGDKAGFALAMPRAEGEIWNDGRFRGERWTNVETIDDVGYLRAVIDDVCARQPIDHRRIYVVGMSNGATMAARLACEHPELIAALAQVAGTAAVRVAATCGPRHPVPIIQIHGPPTERLRTQVVRLAACSRDSSFAVGLSRLSVSTNGPASG